MKHILKTLLVLFLGMSLLTACTSGSPYPVKDETVINDITEMLKYSHHLQTMESVTLTKQAVKDKEYAYEANVVFKDDTATITGTVSGTYRKIDKWIRSGQTLTISSTTAYVQADPEVIKNEIPNLDRPHIEIQEGFAYEYDDFVLVGTSPDLFNNQITYLFQAKSQDFNVKTTLTLEVRAAYTYENGWHAESVIKESLTETTDWVVRCRADFNQFVHGVKSINFSLTGSAIVEWDSLGARSASNTGLEATFTLDGKSYTIPGEIVKVNDVVENGRSIVFVYESPNGTIRVNSKMTIDPIIETRVYTFEVIVDGKYVSKIVYRTDTES